MFKIINKIVCMVLVLLLFSQQTYALSTEEQAPEKWIVWLDNLKREMISRGISKETIEKAYGNRTYYHKTPEVVQKDKKQTEFVLTTGKYVNRLVSENRVKLARQKHRELQKKYKNIEETYGVPLSYLTAFWSVETNFGKNKGKYHLIDSLTNLSYKNRRSKFFKNELYNVLKIMEKHNLEADKMLGSWAGAMGHFQFMPSTYKNYAVDFDGDDFPDIWNSLDDALASAGNYLSELGWNKDEPWGTRVILPWNFDFRDVGRQHSKKVSEWNKIGIRTFDGKKLTFDKELKGSIILPDGRKGPSYIVFGNFKRIMIWNRSDNYALAIVTLTDYIENPHAKWKPLVAQSQYLLNDSEIKKVQKFYNRISGKKIKVDGKLGPKTRKAVKYIQHRARLPEDGYPDYRLLNKIDKYNPKIGFAVPVQPAKVKNK